MSDGPGILITGRDTGMRAALRLVRLLCPREVSSEELAHPRQDYKAVLRVIATGPSRQTSLPGAEEKRS